MSKKKCVKVIKTNGEYVTVGSEFLPKFLICAFLKIMKGKRILLIAKGANGGEEKLLGTDIYEFWPI